MSNPYGLCPSCLGAVKLRERRPNGNDICLNGHEYPSKDSVPENCVKVAQMHQRHADGTSEFISQSGFDARGGVLKGFREWTDSVIARYPLPDGSQWEVHGEDSKDFVLSPDCDAKELSMEHLAEVPGGPLV